jgi:hypothetical protein
VALSGIVFATFLAFSCLGRYDDEGVVLLFVQHMLDGHSIYDRVACLYGPFFLFTRWLVFGVMNVPLGNDALRLEALITWLVTTLFLAMTTWRLVRSFTYGVGITALVWILAVCQLFVLHEEPGHPQEIVALCVSAALFVAVTIEDRRRATAMVLLGGIGAAIVLPKVNVGVFYVLALTISLLALTPRSGAFWRAMRFAAACTAVVLPWMLMKSRFGDEYGGFCFLMTIAILPCLGWAFFGDHFGTIRIGELLWCGLGAAIVAGPMLSFVIWQGNTLGGMVEALYLRTWRSFASAPVGSSVSVSGLAMAFAPIGAGLGLVALWRKSSSRWHFWPLRLLVCLAVFTISASRVREVDLPISCALPLLWLLLVPPAGHELTEPHWFFRLFLSSMACFQPLQIFPVAGSQMLIGTLVLPIAAVVLALDARQELRDEIASQPLLFASRLPALKRLAVIATVVVLMRFRSYEIFGGAWTFPSLMSAWALLAAETGFIVLRFEPSLRNLLWPLKLIVCGAVVAGILTSIPWDMSWFRLVFPLSWLVLVQPPGQEFTLRSAWMRLGLIFCACLETLHLLPVFPFLGSQFHLGAFLMLAIAGLLLVDVGRELRLIDRSKSRVWAFSLTANTLLLGSALLLGVTAMTDAVDGYRKLDPLDLPGCRWTRMPEREATFCTFLAINVRRSSDCVFAQFGLESLHFWAQQRPASDVVPVSNLWGQMDQISDEQLLRAHHDRLRMLFIDNPNPWNRVPPKLKFLDFVSSHFQLLGRLGVTRLLVRKERDDLELFDCAFQRRSASGGEPDPTLILRLPSAPKLQGVAAVELVDLTRSPGTQFLKSTAGPDSECLKLIDTADRLLLPAATGRIDIGGPDQSLRILLPERTDLNAIDFPALRFLDARGGRILTLPVVTDAADAVR